MAFELPTVATRLTADIGEFLAKIKAAQDAVKSLAGEDGEIHIKFDVDTRSLARARTYARQLMATLPDGEIHIKFDVNMASALRAAAATDAVTAATKRGAGGFRAYGLTAMGWLKVLHNVMVLFGSNIIADVLGLTSFGLAAIKTLGPVIKNVSNLGKAWGTFSDYQKLAAVNLHNFLGGLQGHDRQVVMVFDQALQLLGSHMHSAGGITNQAAMAFSNFFVMLKQAFGSAGWKELAAHSTGLIQKDLTLLFQDLTDIINVIPALVHNFNFLGVGILSGFGTLVRAIGWLNAINPTLARFAFLGLSASHAWGWLKKMTWFQGLSKDTGPIMRFTRAIGILSRGEGIAAAGAALTGLSGVALGLGATFGVAAVGIGLAFWRLSQLPQPTDELIAKLTREDKAVGFNTAGYAKLSKQLVYYGNNLGKVTRVGSGAQGALAEAQAAQNRLSEAQQRASQTARNLATNFQWANRTFGQTKNQAIQTAHAIGFDLTHSIRGNSDAAVQARGRWQAYIQTTRGAARVETQLKFDMQQAADSTRGLASQVQGLSNAFNTLLTPFANTIQAEVSWKQGNLDLANAIKKAHGDANGFGNGVQRLAAGALANAIQQTVNLSNSILQSSGSFRKAEQPIRNEIRVLEGLHSKSKLVREAIRDLQRQLDALKSKAITITINHRQINTITGEVGGFGGHSSPGPGQAQTNTNGASLFSNAATILGGGPVSGGATVIHNHTTVLLDGKQIFNSVRKQAFQNQKISGGGRNAFQRPLR